MMKKVILIGISCMGVMISGYAQENKTQEVEQAKIDSLFAEKNLPEIQIVAAKRLVKVEADKTSYQISDDPEAKTNTLLEILRKVPYVSVDGNDQVKVNGSSSFQVYVNGKPSNLYSNNPSEVFRSMPAESVRKVEVITDPGARYDAEGVSGILNIITQKSVFEGYNMNLQAQASNLYQQGSLFGTLKYGKFSVAGNYAYTHLKQKTEVDYWRTQQRGAGEQLQMQQDIRIGSPSHMAGLEASFELDTLNLFSFSASMNLQRPDIDYIGKYRMTDAEKDLIYQYDETQSKQEQLGGGSFKWDYQHTAADNPNELITLSYQYDYLPDDLDNYMTMQNLEGASSALKYLQPFMRQVSKGRKHEHSVQLDYIRPFGKIHSLEGGAKYVLRNNRSRGYTEYKQEESDTWLPSEYQSEVDYRHRQHILALYTSYKLNVRAWSMTAGLRMEHTWQHVRYPQGLGDNFTYRHADWVPSWNGMYRINDSQSLKLGYNLRIRRPDISYLDPTIRISGTSISYGNPTLVSEKHHRLSLAYNYLSNKLSIQCNFIYSIGNHIIDAYNYLDEEGIVNQTYGNIVSTRGYSLGPYISYNPSPTSTITLNGLLGYLSLEVPKGNEIYPDGMHNARWCGSAVLNFTQRLPLGWRLGCTAGFLSSEPDLGNTADSFYFYTCMIQKTFCKDRLSVALRAQNFLQPHTTYKQQERYPDYTSRLESHLHDRSIGVVVNYRFGGLKAQVKKAARSILNNDLKERKVR